MTAPTMLERLRPLGYTGGISILRDKMRELRPEPIREAFHTLHYAPREAMLVDWADFGFALPGVPRRVSAFVAMLGHSRMLYLEFRLSQKQGSFLRCMERALRFFGGRQSPLGAPGTTRSSSSFCAIFVRIPPATRSKMCSRARWRLRRHASRLAEETVAAIDR